MDTKRVLRDMTAPVIEVRGLTLHYGSRCVYRNIDLAVDEGTVTAIVGPSGCGKTSFLHTLTRLTDLVPSATASGTVRIGEVDVLDKRCNLSVLRRRVGMIFQKPAPFPISIRRNLTLPLREHGMKGKDVLKETIERVLTDVGLWSEVRDRLDEPAARLSGGQKQRLCIARALALEPQVLLMDEPCSALDPLASQRIEALIGDLKERYTVVIVTHNLAQARRISDHTAVFWVQDNEGRLIEHNTTECLFEDPQHLSTRAYLSGEQG